MTITSPANINPQLLAWARQESGYPENKIAQRLQVKLDRVLAWERGEQHPTVKQLERVAHFLRRPLSLFFLPQPPKILPLAAERRRLPGVPPSTESPDLRLGIRQMSIRRENAINLFEELRSPAPEFKLAAHLKESPEKVGERLRNATGLKTSDQMSWSTEWVAWAVWRRAIEDLGILVFQFGKVSLQEVRGVALLKTPLPVVGVNSKESAPEAKIFTLVHEVIHLMLAQGHEEKSALEDQHSEKEWNGVEQFVETATSYAIVPEESLKAKIHDLGLQGNNWDIENVRRLGRKFWLTPLAMATRLRSSGYMNWTSYNRWRASWEKRLAGMKKKKGGFANQAEKAIGRNGRPFIRLVLEALESNRLTSVDAARYLDLKFHHFGMLKTHLALKSAMERRRA